MKNRITLALLSACIVLAIATCGVPRGPAHAMSIIQPGGAALQGNPICTDTPTADSALVWTGADWCGSALPTLRTLQLTQRTIDTFGLIITADNANQPVLQSKASGDSDYRFQYQIGTGLEIGNGTAAPTLVIDESGNWKGNAVTSASGIVGYTCAPTANVSIPASTLTTVCTVTTSTLPSAPHGTWLIQATGQVEDVNGASSTTCVTQLTVGSAATANAITSYGGDPITPATTLQTQVSASTALTMTLSSYCVAAMTAFQYDKLLTSTPASFATLTVTPQ